MSDSEAPGGGKVLELPCRARKAVRDLDMGLREFDCEGAARPTPS